MVLSFEAIIWYLILVDAVFANLTVLFWKKWYVRKKFNKILPMNGLWTLLYLALVVWVGFGLWRLRIVG